MVAKWGGPGGTDDSRGVLVSVGVAMRKSTNEDQLNTVPCINNWSFRFLQNLFARLCSDPKWKFCLFVKLQLATTWIYCSLYTLKTHKNDYLGTLVPPH